MTAVRGLVCAIAVAGCGRVNFDPLFDGGSVVGDAAFDDARDVAPDRTCWSAWRSGSPVVSPPRLVTEVNGSGYTADPFIASDDRTLYFVRSNGFDVYVTQRPERGMPFAPPTVDVSLTSASNDSRVSLTDDMLLAAIATQRAPTLGGLDLWLAERTMPTGTWGSLSKALTGALNSANHEFDPNINRDGTRLYFASGPTGAQQLQVASRPDRSTAFAAPVAVMNVVAGATYTADVTLSPDELVIAYSAGIGASPADIYFATRATIGDPFSASMPVPSVNAAEVDGDAALSADGCELFLSSNRGGGTYSIYVANITP